jgi:hypothetical protein
VYVIECVPAPATDGLKVVPETPVPLYVPPTGDPPLSVNGDELVHIGLNACSVTLLPVELIVMFHVVVYVGSTVLDIAVVSEAVMVNV